MSELIIMNIKKTWKSKLFFCPFDECGAGLANFGTNIALSTELEGLIEAQCPKCTRTWFLCWTCAKMKRNSIHPLLTTRAVYNHNYRLHQQPIPKAKKRKELTCGKDDYESIIERFIPRRLAADNYDAEDYACVSNESEQSDIEYDDDVSENCDPCPVWNDDSHSDTERTCLTEAVNEQKDAALLLGLKDLAKASHWNCNMYNQSTCRDELDFEKLVFYKVNKQMSLFHGHNCTDNSGLKYLVSKSYTSSEQVLSSVSPDQIHFQLLLTQFVRDLTRRQQKDFANVLQQLHKLYIIPARPESTAIPLPTTYNEFCGRYTEGAFSIAANMPKPRSIMLSKHSYLPITECIADFLLQGAVPITASVDVPCTVPSPIFETVIAKQIIAEARARYHKAGINPVLPLVTIFFMLWSDDFEPNKGTKANRQSVWSATATLFVMTSEGKPEFRTYPISFGRKGIDHEEVQKSILEDINSLRDDRFIVMYSSYLKTPVCVHADIFAVLNDHPERRSSLKLGAGNSAYHTRFGTSCRFDLLRDVILPCRDCKAQNRRFFEIVRSDANQLAANNFDMWSSMTCENCVNWFLYNKSPLIKYSAEKNYPLDPLRRTQMLSVHALSFPDLMDSVKNVHQKVKQDNMPKRNVIAVLKHKCLNNESIEQIYENAYNCRLLKIAKENKDTDPSTFAELLQNKRDEPEKYRMWSIPSNWKLFPDCTRHVEVPMHLLFLNCQKMVVMDIHCWLKCKKQFAAFQTKVKGILEEVQKLQLGWVKLLPYPDGKGAGWVSENWMGLCRVSLWLYQILESLPTPAEYSDPNTDPRTWTKKETTAWLLARGLPVRNDNAPELKEMVTSFYESGAVPEIIPVKGCSLSLVLEMIRSYQYVVRIAMGDTPVEQLPVIMGIAVRHFLTIYSEFADSIAESKESLYFTRYSVMALLNLPEQVKRYGSLKNLWEGGMRGEGFLRKAKPEIKRGLNRNWPKWLLDHLVLDQTCADWFETTRTKVPGRNQELSEVKIYKNRSSAVSSVNTGLPFGGMAIKNGQHMYHYLVFYDEKVLKKIEMRFLRTNTVVNELSYFIVQLDMIDTGDLAETGLSEGLEGSILGLVCLPQLTAGKYDRRVREEDIVQYTAIYSDWSCYKTVEE